MKPNVDSPELRTLSLFSGVGGLDLGLERAVRSLGGTTQPVAYVERESFAAAVLVARMEEGRLAPAPVFTDVTRFDGRPFRGMVDIVVGGYPCQPFSVAGKQAGADDERHLWPHFARIVRECQPSVVFAENVAGHLRLGFAEVAAELRGMGYRVAASLWRASEVGAPHRRERLFVLAYSERGGSGAEGAHPERQGRERAEAGRAGVPHGPEGQPRQSDPDGWDSGREALAAADTKGRGDDMGDTRGRRGKESGAGLEGLRTLPYQGSQQLPRWPPGPGEADAWARVLAVRPDLAPALDVGVDARLVRTELGRALRSIAPGINRRARRRSARDIAAALVRAMQIPEAQPAIRGLAHGPWRKRMDRAMSHRTDRLRALGNAVVQAEAAFLELWEEIRCRT